MTIDKIKYVTNTLIGGEKWEKKPLSGFESIPMNLNTDKYAVRRRQIRLNENYIFYNYGISWQCNDKKTICFEDNKIIYGYPSPKLDLMIVIYSNDSKLFPYPKNLVVFKADGSLLHNVEVPPFVSRDANQLNLKGRKGDFGSISWIKDDDTNLSIGISSYEIEEYREFNPYTGKFGKNIGPVSLELYSK
tara:strand:- start:13 stop:582 length:570 start_codon:yes stop_codon:yes gene_type:complete